MVGREVLLQVERGVSRPGEVVLAIDGLRVRDDRGHETVQGVDLAVRSGEIVGIAGVAGNGQDELVESVVGLRKPQSGHVRLSGSDIAGWPTRRIRDLGVAYIPADRQRFGLVLTHTVKDNIVLTSYHEPPFAGGPFHILRIDRAVEEWSDRLIGEFDIRTPSPNVPAATLSGGNQQKIIVAREFREANKLLVLDQPTRGLDVGSIEFIHKRVIEKRNAGAAVLLVSADLDEVLELSDRIAVIFRGKFVASFEASEARRDRIGMFMARGAA
jgi:ABC-type uncharacterized transport system ATPase subunit